MLLAIRMTSSLDRFILIFVDVVDSVGFAQAVACCMLLLWSFDNLLSIMAYPSLLYIAMNKFY